VPAALAEQATALRLDVSDEGVPLHADMTKGSRVTT